MPEALARILLTMLVGLALPAALATGNDTPLEAKTPTPDKATYLSNIAGDTSVDEQTHTVVIQSSADANRKKAKPADAKPAFVPPGFEDLMQPQTTLVDIYYGDTFLVTATAVFTPTWISFPDPSEIVDKVPDLLEPDKIAERLKQELPTNSEFACLKKNQTDCGRMETESVDVIFDEGHFRADLFISPDLLAVRPSTETRFLPPSSGGLSFLDTLGTAINGESGGNRNYNIGNSTTIAYKENRLIAVSSITPEDHLTFDELALEREINGHAYQAGIFRSSPADFLFMGQTHFAGLSIASSLNTRKDLDQSSGNDLQVFLDSRSRVDILKDGRLISTAIYDTGNQIIDTSQLPGGAYDIVLRIRDNLGNVREETRFYIKTTRLPPIDQPLFFIDAGSEVKLQPGDTLPSSQNQDFFRAGVTRRLTDSFGGGIGVLAIGDEKLLESSLFTIGQFYEARLGFAQDNSGDHGASINARLRLGRAVLQGTGRKVWSSDKSRLAPSVMGDALSQTSLSLSIPVGTTMLNFTSRYNRREGLDADRNVGLRIDFPTYSMANRYLQTSFQWTRNNGDTLVLVGFKLSVQANRWQHQIESRYYRDNTEGNPVERGFISSATSLWQDGDKYLSDVDIALRANRERDDRTLESDINIASDLGRSNLNAIYSLDNKRLNYGANIFTSLIANSDTLVVGGKRQAQSAVVLDIGGKAQDAYFDVNVNGVHRTNARIGKKTIVSLAPYQTYKVELKPRGTSLVDFDNIVKSATLYPGNVVSLKWATRRVLVAFGEIVDPSGEPIGNALIEGVQGLATTDDSGLFQAEIESTTHTLKVKTRSSECNVDLPEYDATQMVVTFDKLTCR